MEEKIPLVTHENVVKAPELKDGQGCSVVRAERWLPLKVWRWPEMREVARCKKEEGKKEKA